MGILLIIFTAITENAQLRYVSKITQKIHIIKL